MQRAFVLILLDAQSAFTRAAALLHCEEDARFQAFGMTVKVPGFESAEDTLESTAPLGDVLGLSCTLKWPLQLVFTEDVIAKSRPVKEIVLTCCQVQYFVSVPFQSQVRPNWIEPNLGHTGERLVVVWA